MGDGLRVVGGAEVRAEVALEPHQGRVLEELHCCVRRADQESKNWFLIWCGGAGREGERGGVEVLFRRAGRTEAVGEF